MNEYGDHDTRKSDRQAAQELVRTYLHDAEIGDVDAQYQLAMALLNGQGIAQDQALARIWFALAGKTLAAASNMLARCWEKGWGGPQNEQQARTTYQNAIAQGSHWARYNLANMYATARGGQEDHATAFRLYQEAALAGHAKSMNLLGRYLEEGIVCPPDPQQALYWYEQSAQAGDFRGQFSLAAVYYAQGNYSDCNHWLWQSLQNGHRAFIEQAAQQLAHFNEPELAEVVKAFQEKAA